MLLGRVPLKSALGIGGSILSVGGASGLAYSSPTILRQVGAVCDVLGEAKAAQNQRLNGGHFYLREGQTDNYLDVTKEQQEKIENSGRCWVKNK